MSAGVHYDEARASFVLEGAVADDRYRLLVPKDFLDDELGANASLQAQTDWIEANLPQILAAYTARTEGGWVKAPWDRVMVEETD